MNIVQAPAKHGVHDKFAHMLLDFTVTRRSTPTRR